MKEVEQISGAELKLLIAAITLAEINESQELIKESQERTLKNIEIK